jgi:acetyltransferase-like isoleucine patch superfamily enzyme
MFSFLNHRLKQLAKRLLFRPRGLRMGESSVFRRPWNIKNPNRIVTGDRARIGRHVVLNALNDYEGRPQDGHIVLGNDVYIGGYSQIHAMNLVEIGDGCVLSEHVYVSDIAHGLDPRAGLIMKQPLESKGPVRLGRHVFIGYGCSVLPGVSLGDHCIVGTRSTVTRSFPAYSMIGGAPAKLLKVFDHARGEWVNPAPPPGNVHIYQETP